MMNTPLPPPTSFLRRELGVACIGLLGLAPFVSVAAQTEEDVTVVAGGLTNPRGFVWGADGTLYALEMATGNSDEPPFVAPGTGKVVRQTGPDTAEDVATGLTFPVKMEVGPDGALYVGYPAFGAIIGEGGILRFDLASGEAIAIDDAMLTGAECTA